MIGGGGGSSGGGPFLVLGRPGSKGAGEPASVARAAADARGLKFGTLDAKLADK